MIQFQQLLDLMARQDIAQTSDLVGVPYSEIKAMEAYFGLNFPQAYVDFLHICGRSAGHLAGWSAIYFDDLKEIADEFEFNLALIKHKNSTQHSLLPAQALLIAHYENYFDYLVCNDQETGIFRLSFVDDNASVFRFSETFHQYIESMILAAANANGRVAPFFVDECGNMVSDDLRMEAPGVE